MLEHAAHAAHNASEVVGFFGATAAAVSSGWGLWAHLRARSERRSRCAAESEVRMWRHKYMAATRALAEKTKTKVE